MMGCNYFPFFPWMGGGFAGGIFSILLWILLLLLLLFLVVKISGLTRTDKNWQYRDQNDSLDILKIRYAKGEIGQAEFLKMKDILLKA